MANLGLNEQKAALIKQRDALVASGGSKNDIAQINQHIQFIDAQLHAPGALSFANKPMSNFEFFYDPKGSNDKTAKELSKKDSISNAKLEAELKSIEKALGFIKVPKKFDHKKMSEIDKQMLESTAKAKSEDQLKVIKEAEKEVQQAEIKKSPPKFKD